MESPCKELSYGLSKDNSSGQLKKEHFSPKGAGVGGDLGGECSEPREV